MPDDVSLSEVRVFGRRAVEERDSAALDTLIELSRTSHRPEIRGTTALFLGAIDWDLRPISALSRLLADPGFVNLSEHPDFTDVLNSFKMYAGKVIPFGVAVATLATHTTGGVGVPIKKIAEVALFERAGRGRVYGGGGIADPEALLELLVTRDLPIDPGLSDPVLRGSEEFRWRDGAVRHLSLYKSDLRAEHIPALVAQAAAWFEYGGVNKTLNFAGGMLRQRVDLWTAEVIALPIAAADKHVRVSVAHDLTLLAKRGDASTRIYLERLAGDGDRSVAKAAAKGLKALGKR